MDPLSMVAGLPSFASSATSSAGSSAQTGNFSFAASGGRVDQSTGADLARVLLIAGGVALAWRFLRRKGG